ncbi:hypothetical protein QYF36_017457 [Acer negundo]|nr:hypothetical protein QYF36_017457 [Acer negundo]
MITPTGGGEGVLKPKAQWSTQEFEASKIAKKASDILETAHEGTEVVKYSKLQVLLTKFETIRMEENECFNDFQVKLMDIVNQSHQLGDPYSDRSIKQKIMRSLPERFESKVTTLEENSEYTKMKPNKVIGRLLAYESRKAPTTTPPNKQKCFVLKSIKMKKKEEDSDEEIALMAKKFKQFVRFEKKGFGFKGKFKKKKTHFKKVEQTQEKDHKKENSSNSNFEIDEEMDYNDCMRFLENSRLKKKNEIQKLKGEKLELTSKVTHLSVKMSKTNEMEEGLKMEIVLAKKNEESLWKQEG